MRIKKLMKLIGILSFILLSHSCIRDEALNTECDIVTASLKEDCLIGSPIIENNRIFFLVKPGTDITALSPLFTLTPGATIKPASGTVRDFSSPQTYMITSQDGEWKKVYEVSISFQKVQTRYSFEHFEQKSETLHQYHIFYELENGNKSYLWSTANQGFSIMNANKPAETYPTYSISDGHIGRGVSMTTRSTGMLGNMMKMPIAAGNLFIGTFDVSAASTPNTALKSTQFGKPFPLVPRFIKGWYKYLPGKVFTDSKNNVVAGKIDKFDIYAVFYEPTAEKPFLTGDNILTDETIIAVARLTDHSPKSEYTLFEVPFVYKEGKSIDKNKLNNLKYNIAIVCSSSIDGASFNGAVGSTLVVDELEIIYDEK